MSDAWGAPEQSVQPQRQPVLTVYVPTYNRAELLRTLLYALAPQAKMLGDRVEVLISDNCSSDHTRAVVEAAQEFGPLQYHCNAENIGGGRNVLQGVYELAQGEFVWVIGDDDLVRETALEEVVQVIEANRDLDYFFVNNMFLSPRPEGLIRSHDCPDSNDLRCRVRESRRVDKWENIVKFTDADALFTFIGNHILRVSMMRTHPVTTEGSGAAAEFASVERTYPLPLAIARVMVGRPAMYIGDPKMICFMGDFRSSDSDPYIPLLQVVRQLELCERIAAHGAESGAMRRYRNLQLSGSAYNFWYILNGKATEGRDQVHPWQMFLRYASYPGFWRMLTLYPINTYVKPLFRPLIRIMRLNRQRSAA